MGHGCLRTPRTEHTSAKFIRFYEICRKTTGVRVRLPIPGPLDTIPRPRECVPATTCGTCRTGRTPCLAQPGPAPCHGGASEQGGDLCFIGEGQSVWSRFSPDTCGFGSLTGTCVPASWRRGSRARLNLHVHQAACGPCPRPAYRKGSESC